MFAREPSAEGVPPDPDAQAAACKVTLWELMEAFRAVLKRAAARSGAPGRRPRRCRCATRIGGLLRTLGVARTADFDSLFGDAADARLRDRHLPRRARADEAAARSRRVQEEALGPILIVLAVEDVRDVTIDLLDEYDGNAGAPAPDRAVGG